MGKMGIRKQRTLMSWWFSVLFQFPFCQFLKTLKFGSMNKIIYGAKVYINNNEFTFMLLKPSINRPAGDFTFKKWRKSSLAAAAVMAAASWRRWYYPHWSRDALSPVCVVFFLHPPSPNTSPLHPPVCCPLHSISQWQLTALLAAASHVFHGPHISHISHISNISHIPHISDISPIYNFLNSHITHNSDTSQIYHISLVHCIYPTCIT